MFLREGDRFRGDYEAMHEPLDASPFPHGLRVRQSARDVILAEVANDPDRSAELNPREELYFDVTNSIIAASAPRRPVAPQQPQQVGRRGRDPRPLPLQQQAR